MKPFLCCSLCNAEFVVLQHYPLSYVMIQPASHSKSSIVLSRWWSDNSCNLKCYESNTSVPLTWQQQQIHFHSCCEWMGLRGSWRRGRGTVFVLNNNKWRSKLWRARSARCLGEFALCCIEIQHRANYFKKSQFSLKHCACALWLWQHPIYPYVWRLEVCFSVQVVQRLSKGNLCTVLTKSWHEYPRSHHQCKIINMRTLKCV